MITDIQIAKPSGHRRRWLRPAVESGKILTCSEDAVFNMTATMCAFSCEWKAHG